jgi:hypothetical protein
LRSRRIATCRSSSSAWTSAASPGACASITPTVMPACAAGIPIRPTRHGQQVGQSRPERSLHAAAQGDRGSLMCGASRLAASSCGLPSGKPRSTRAFSQACRAWVI